LWREVLRVLKPGGHLLAFAGTRTQHRMATAIEDAGFEIRDMIAWVYGSGFPKSLDVSKAIDKAAGAERDKVPATGGLHKNANLNDDGWSKIGNSAAVMDSCTPATEAAKQWAGWGTALKPSLEPITVARKPLCGTVAANVLQYGTGGLNVDGCRVGTGEWVPGGGKSKRGADGGGIYGDGAAQQNAQPHDAGRWPANLIHDGSDEVVGLFPEDGDASAARFFYCAKAGPEERRQSKHPTIKPVALMRYLVRLVTPPGGLVLDPFGGSGTTAEAARLEHCRFLLMELNPEYCADAAERLRQGVLF
jgi:site-specific DNA-methyltransferase (adenine-specific)